MKVDLHIHTNKSDGIFSEIEIYELLKNNEIKYFAITDHDNIDAVKIFSEMQLNEKMVFIPGIEFTIDFTGGEFHLLGYNVNYKNKELNYIINELKESRINRSKLIIDDFRKAGIDISYEEVLSEFPDTKSVGKPHIARILVKRGIVKDINRAFTKYFKNGKVGDIPKKRIKLDKAIEIIENSGGFAVIAHPKSLNIDRAEFETKISEWKKLGVCGLEAYASLHRKSEIEYYKSICEQYGLIISGGSDFHGDRYEKLGYYGNKELNENNFEMFLKKAGY